MSREAIPDGEAGLLAACALMAAQIAVQYGVSARRYSEIMREARRLASVIATPAGKGEQG